MTQRSKLTQAALRELLDYDPSTGEFVWKIMASTRAVVGSRAGKIDSYGYRSIKFNGLDYRAHRLAWLWIYGVWPTHQIDHINGVRDDNRISNLRDVPYVLNAQNKLGPQKNNKCGLRGVTSKGSKWQAQIRFPGGKCYLGTFDTREQAHVAYLEAKAALHEGYVPASQQQEG